MQHLQPNTTLQGGKYRIERVLGQGGFGITYLARNTVFDIDVAIKEFFMKDENGRDGNTVTMPNLTKSELFNGQKEKFKKEAKRMFAIKNEHIIGVHDLFEENGTAYYVMDYIDGESLSARMKRTGKPMAESEVNNILPQILDALKVIHDNGIWHLDLKPANIMIDKAGNVKLIDFGASKQLNAQKGGATTSTAISYTNGYAPREQMEQNYDKFGPWTDIYALGATLYNLLTNNKPPLPSDIDDDETKDKHEALPFPDDVCVETKSMVLWFLNTNRQQRPQSVDVIINAFKLEKVSLQKSTEQLIATREVDNDDEEETIILKKEAEREQGFKLDLKKELLTENTDESDLNDSNDSKKLMRRMALIIVASALLFFVYLGYQNNRADDFSANNGAQSNAVIDKVSSSTLAVEDLKDREQEIPYDELEVKPSFPGGLTALTQWFNGNVNYPAKAAKDGVEGRVIVEFVVEKDGSINDVKVVQSVDPLLDKEAVRVVKSMPSWIPGKQNGVVVRVKFSIPITFKLE